MRLLKKLETNKTFWILLLLSFVFFLFRFPSLIEPNWYGDEGIYQTIGVAMDHGRVLYAQVWDNKPPLLYVVYAIFNGDQFSVRLASIFFGIGATVIFYLLSQQLFRSKKVSIRLTILFTILLASPLLEGNIANAENFMIFPVLIAVYMGYKTIASGSFARKKRIAFSIGLLLGISFLFKIVAIFDLCTLLFLLGITLENRQKMHTGNRLTLLDKAGIFENILLLVGFVIPFIISIVYFASQHALGAYFKSAFLGNVSYVSYQNTFLNIPQGFLLMKTILLFALLTLVIRLRNKLTTAKLFIYTWMIFSLYDAFFSQRPYTHYVLVLLPSFCLFIGLVITATNRKSRIITGAILALITLVVGISFDFYSVGKSLFYYQNFVRYITRQESVTDYQAYFDAKTPRDYALAKYIREHIPSSQSVFIWGDSPQIYVLSNTIPPIKYTVAYHMMTSEQTLQEAQSEVDKAQPNYIITLSEAPPFPLHAPGYTGKFLLKGAAIYERTL